MGLQQTGRGVKVGVIKLYPGGSLKVFPSPAADVTYAAVACLYGASESRTTWSPPPGASEGIQRSRPESRVEKKRRRIQTGATFLRPSLAAERRQSFSSVPEP